MSAREFRAGDVIVNGYGRHRFYRVLDPPRTSRGKLRLVREGSGTVFTTWWRDTGSLPKRHHMLAEHLIDPA